MKIIHMPKQFTGRGKALDDYVTNFGTPKRR
jgi:hypothetical protein